MKTKTRYGVFETNSSSSHTLSTVTNCKRIPTPEVMGLTGGEVTINLFECPQDVDEEGLWEFKDKVAAVLQTYFYNILTEDENNEDLWHSDAVPKAEMEQFRTDENIVKFIEALNQRIKEKYPNNTTTLVLDIDKFYNTKRYAYQEENSIYINAPYNEAMNQIIMGKDINDLQGLLSMVDFCINTDEYINTEYYYS